MRYNGASGNDTMVPDGHAGQNNDPRSNPAIISDGNWLFRFGPLPVDGNVRPGKFMTRCHHDNIRTHDHVITNRDGSLKAGILSQLASVTNL